MAKFPGAAKTAVIKKSKETVDDVLSEKSSAMSRLYHDSHERLAKRRMSAKKIQLVQQWLDSKLTDKHDSHEEYVSQRSLPVVSKTIELSFVPLI